MRKITTIFLAAFMLVGMAAAVEGAPEPEEGEMGITQNMPDMPENASENAQGLMDKLPSLGFLGDMMSENSEAEDVEAPEMPDMPEESSSSVTERLTGLFSGIFGQQAEQPENDSSEQ